MPPDALGEEKHSYLGYLEHWVLQAHALGFGENKREDWGCSYVLEHLPGMFEALDLSRALTEEEREELCWGWQAEL